uniref:CUB domain-containing protein n=1 Tax=Biomphalaria glabrata TaxID=6526 RepID=A0A2C9KKE3_BIOGL
MKSRITKHSCFLLVMLLMFHHIVETQINPADDPNNVNAASNLFFFDRKSDCNGPIRNLYGLQGTIRGSDLASQLLGPKECMIRLKSEGQFDGIVLDIEVKAMNILDCLTTVTIYDGDGKQNILMSYDCRSGESLNKRRFYSSGNTATFVMNRENVNSYSFDIEIIVLPVRASQDPNYENNYGKENPYAFDKFPQEYIVGMLSGFYLFVVVVCLVVIFRTCFQFRVLNKKWETQQLATLKASSAYDVRSQMTSPSQMTSIDQIKSHGPSSQYSRGTTQPTARKAPPSEDGDSGVYYNDDINQKRRLVNEQRVNAKPTNSVYSEPEEAPESFREKIIIPTKHKGKNRRQPPSYDEAVSDQSSDEGSQASSNSSLPRKRPPSSDEERSVKSKSSEWSKSTTRTRSTRTASSSETESEESHSEASSSGHQARAQRKKPKKQSEPKRSQQPPPQKQTRQHMPLPQMQQPPRMQQPFVRPPPMYSAYPPGQYVPIMSGPQFQPVPGAYPPPRYPVQPQPSRGLQVEPTDAPVYSYLVQRGYKPIDPASISQNSSDSHRSGGRRLEESDLRLDSGVEYMKR